MCGQRERERERGLVKALCTAGGADVCGESGPGGCESALRAAVRLLHYPGSQCRVYLLFHCTQQYRYIVLTLHSAAEITVLIPDAVLTERDILQLHSALSDAIKSITEFLNSLPPPLPPHNPLISATVRLLGSWLAEESLMVPSELQQLLPRLLDMCKTHLQQQTQGQGERTDSATTEERCLQNPLKFLLPGLSHLMADDVHRAIVKICLPQLLLNYMNTLYSSLSKMR